MVAAAQPKPMPFRMLQATTMATLWPAREVSTKPTAEMTMPQKASQRFDILSMMNGVTNMKPICARDRELDRMG